MAASSEAVNSAARVWTPFKELQQVVESAIHKKQPEAVHDMEVMLRKHKSDFMALLKNTPKNTTDRSAVKKSNTVGLTIRGEQRTQTFPESYIGEALIVSDLFDLNEVAALELLVAGEDHRADFPGLTRGLVAVLLYYDGRRSVVVALRTLLLSLVGRTWTLGLSPDLTHITDTYIRQLVDNNLTNKLLDVIKTMDVTAELDKLQNNRALGPPKHRKQVQDIYSEIRATCADCLFCLACQRPLGKADTLQLLAHLRGDDSLAADGTLTPVTLALLMALLYCFDVSVLEREDMEDAGASLPVLSDQGYIAAIHRELKDATWKLPGMKATAQFAWGVMLRQLSQYPAAAGAGDYFEEDELMLDLAIEGQVFTFLLRSVVTLDKFHKEEFYLRRIHGLLTDFIYHMPLKVKEVRNRGDETARIMMAHMQEGQEPPASLRRDFEHMLYVVGRVYGRDPLGLGLSLDYWCPPEPSGLQDSYHHRPPQRQVALYKFVRLAGDLLPASLYVPYITMLAGLANSPQAAQHCYNLLKMNGGSSSTVSWDHVFASLNQYYSSLRREVPSAAETTYQYRGHSRTITPQELEGLVAVLQLIRTLMEQSENCRVAICENQQWSVVMLTFGLITCSVPPSMKSELLRTLAALARTPEIASTLWQTLEASQILVTVPSSGKQTGGVQVELEEIEARNEEYLICRAFLQLLTTLTDTPVPQALGAGVRAPGFDPYLEFVRDSVFLKFGSRAYKNPAEKWEVARLAADILRKLLHDHDVVAEHFTDQVLEVAGGGSIIANKPPGHTLLLHMLKDGRILHMILRILDEAMRSFEQYIDIPGQRDLQATALACLHMLEAALGKEAQFVAMVRESGSALLVTPLDKLLLGINPRTGKADHVVTIAKYLMFGSQMPEQALSAMRILYLMSKSAPIQSDLVTLFNENQETSENLLHGFVECLDSDDVEEEPADPDQDNTEEDQSSSQMGNATRQHLLKLILHVLDQPAPNLAHFLLGFEISKPVNKTNLQDPGVLNSPKTCLHSVLAILCRGLGAGGGPQCLSETPRLAELGYRLVYTLAANKDTSAPTLRYLRTSHDFLNRQLQHMPYDQKLFNHSVANHQSWLLKTVTVELRVTSINRQRSHTQRLLRLILDDYDEDQTAVMQVAGAEQSDVSFSRYADQTTSQYGRAMRGRQFRRRIMSLLDCVKFCQPYPPQLNLEFFDPRLIQQVIASIEEHDEDGVAFYDVKALHRILMNELNNLQGTTMAGQRQLILEEIEMVLKTVIARNNVCQSLHAKHQTFDAWRQMTEVILTACPEDLLQGEIRQTILFEILQDLLMKVSDENALAELTAPVAGIILTLLANLRQCFLSESPDTGDKEARDSRYITLLDQSAPPSQTVAWGQGSSGSRTLFATSLQMVLKGLIEHIMRSSGGQQRVRAKLYGALLFYLQIAQRPRPALAHLEDEGGQGIDARLMSGSDTEYEQLHKENIATILSYGDTFMDLVCRDACDGLDVGRMLALSVLDSVLTMDKFSRWMSFLSSKGYLQHLVDSLAADDDKLTALLTGGPTANLKVLYLYESKMSLLTRVAETSVGASTLLRCGVMQRLASCVFFDMRPEMDRNQLTFADDDEFLPDPISRYRHLLFATLKLCLAVLTSLGVENSEAGLQVMTFIVGHGDVFHTILRDRQPALNLHAQQELALTTAVLARANYTGDEHSELESGDTAEIEFRGHRARIQRQMVALLPKFCVSEKLGKQLRNLEAQAGEGRGHAQGEVLQAYLDVATNVTSYCRTLVSSSAGPSAQYCRILFGPNLEEAMARDLRNSDEVSMSTMGVAQAPNLGVVVYQLKQCASQFMAVFEARKQHLRKLESLSELSTDDLNQFSGVSATDKMSSQRRQQLAKRRLTLIVAYHYRELQSYAYIIENSVFLLWRHLEYYLIHCVPSDQQQSLYYNQSRRQHQMRRLQDVAGVAGSPVEPRTGESLPSVSMDDLRRGVTQQEIDTLKHAAVSVLGDSLFKKIQEINQIFCKSRSHCGFVEAVVRRIKRLLRLHTGS